jgi:omega-6 fatty acid desaturase (delta-12 desaturase)
MAVSVNADAAPVDADASSGTPDGPVKIGRDRSLNVVRDAIPDECYERPTGRAMVSVAQAFVLYGLTLVGLALTDRWYLLLPLWAVASLAVAGLFILGHDASHGALLNSPKLNRRVARICMLPSVHVESLWDLGHNRIHHGYTTREGFDFVWHPITPAQYAAYGRLGRLRHRFEWSWLGSGAYFMRTVWWQKMMRFQAPEKRKKLMNRDRGMVGGVFLGAVAVTAAIGFWADGLGHAFWMPVKLIVIPFLLFLQVIGWTVYVHHVAPDIRWWPRREWSQFKGQMESTTIVQVPRLLNRLFFHNIFVHVPHHVDVRIPFHKLPKAAKAIADAFPGTVRTLPFSLRGYLRSTKSCKLYDFEAGQWLPYRAARGLTPGTTPVSEAA